MAQIVIGQHQTGHRFDDRNGARHYARIVPPFGFQDSRISSRIDCFLRLQQSGDGFEGYAETDVHPIGNTPLDSPGMVGTRHDPAILRSRKDIVMFRAFHGRGSEAASVFESMNGVDAQHRLTQIGVEFIEYRFTPSGWHATDEAGDDTAGGIAQ